MHVTRLISRPSAFASYQAYSEKLSSIPTRGSAKIIDRLCAGNASQPFANVSLFETDVVEPKFFSSPVQISRAGELRLLLAREGLHSARRSLNLDGNFDRDYSPLLNKALCPEQPQAAFNRLIAKFFTPSEDITNGAKT